VQENRASIVATIKAYAVFAAIAWCLVLAAPFIPSTSGALPITALVLGVALAIYLNRRVEPRGPFPPRA
jgi:hypothetical protein